MAFYKKGQVRFDGKSGKGSVLDVIREVAGIRSNHGAAFLRSLLGKNRSIRVEKMRINGRGRPTPVASKEVLKMVAEACPCTRSSTVSTLHREKVVKLISDSRPLKKKGRKLEGRAFGPLALAAIIRKC